MRRDPIAAACLAVFAGGSSLAGAYAADQGLRAEVQVTARDGRAARLGETASVSLSYVDAATGKAPEGLRPDAWIRVVAPDRLPCRDAAQSFRITRSLRRDDVPLFGAWIGVSHDDGRFSLIDPKIDFQGTNLAAMESLGEQPAAAVMARDGAAMLASLPNRGEVVRLTLPDLESTVLARGLGQPGAMLAGDGGAFLVSDKESSSVLHFDQQGHEIGRIAVGDGSVALVEIPASPLFQPSVFASSDNGAAVWFDRRSRQIIRAYPAGTVRNGAAVVAWPGGLAFAKGGRDGDLAIAYRDAPTQLWDIASDKPVEGVAVDPRGRYLLAWSNAIQQAELIEIAFGRVVQTFELGAPISDVTFSGDTAFVGYRGQPTLSIIDLGSRRSGEEALVRPVQLDSGVTNATVNPVVRLQPIGDDDIALVWLEGGNTGFVVQGGAMHATPIVGTIAIKGAPAKALTVLERGLREVGPGAFKADVRLPQRGPLEVVATTGVAGVTTCQAIELAAGSVVEAPKIPRLEMVSETPLAPARPQTLRLRLADVGSGAYAEPSIRLLAMSLLGGWSREISAQRQADGSYAATVTFPAKGDYPVIMPRTIQGKEVTPVVVEVR